MKAAGYKGRLSGGRRKVEKDRMAVTGVSVKMREREKKEGDMRQEGDNRCRGAGAQKMSDRDEIREEMVKGVRKGGERVNLEDWLRRFKQAKRATMARRQGRESGERGFGTKAKKA